MPLPTERDYDATDDGPLPHTTVNALQDAIAGGHHGTVKRHVSAAAGVKDSGGPAGVAFQSGWAGSPPMWQNTGGVAGVVDFPLPVAEGEVLEAVEVYGREGDAGAEHWDAKVFVVNLSDETVTLLDAMKSVAGGTNGPVSVEWTGADTDFPYTVGADESIYVSCNIESGSVTREVGIYGIRLNVSKVP